MIQNFGFSLALPGAGKSYWIEQHYLNIFNFASYVKWLRSNLYMDEYNNNIILSPVYLPMYLSGVAKGYNNNRPDCIVIAADDITGKIEYIEIMLFNPITLTSTRQC